jgi:hypothetical protein
VPNRVFLSQMCEYYLLLAVRVLLGFTHCGAGEGTRTLTAFPPADFESAASTSSATPAQCAIIAEVTRFIKL